MGAAWKYKHFVSMKKVLTFQYVLCISKAKILKLLSTLGYNDNILGFVFFSGVVVPGVFTGQFLLFVIIVGKENGAQCPF